jgi:hypothetical protein
MNCEFCGHKLQFSHYENKKEIVIYDCINCTVLVSFHFFLGERKAGDPVRTKTNFMIDRHGRTYVWTNNYLENNSNIVDLSVSIDIRENTSPLLVTFPKVMNINPTNIHEKFSFYMTFL